MDEKEPLVPTSLEGIIGEFVEPKPIQRDEYGRFIHQEKTKFTPTHMPMGAAIPEVEDYEDDS